MAAGLRAVGAALDEEAAAAAAEVRPQGTAPCARTCSGAHIVLCVCVCVLRGAQCAASRAGVFEVLRGGGGGAESVDGRDLSDDALMRSVDACGGAACANPLLRLECGGRRAVPQCARAIV